jgi:hypothetical protein
MAGNDDALSFSNDEAETLKEIVNDWLNEELVLPPFAPEVKSILEKLNLPVPSEG